MLRIDVSRESTDVVRFRLSGQLTGPWVQELANACGRMGGISAIEALDVTDLDFADSLGMSLLKQFRDTGVHLEGLSPFLAAQLQLPAERRNFTTETQRH